jgi:hypothetical protein
VNDVKSNVGVKQITFLLVALQVVGACAYVPISIWLDVHLLSMSDGCWRQTAVSEKHQQPTAAPH